MDDRPMFEVVPTTEQVEELAEAFRGREVIKLNTEESQAKLEMAGDFGFEDEDEDWVTWRPVDKAGYRPKPRLLRPHIKDPNNPTWEDYLTPENMGQDWYILGAGASALEHGPSLDGQIVYGINWTTRWFMPTFLQMIDPIPFMAEYEGSSARWLEKETQPVTSEYMLRAHIGNDPEFLAFKHQHPEAVEARTVNSFAEEHTERMGWAKNSLWHALQVAYWFKPRRIILLGFDWGGPHLFGNGATVGCHGIYSGKNDLDDQIRWMRDNLERRGMIIRHVGPTGLDCFKQVSSVEEALES